jgi:RNA 2',3'-cyclic 3'-phosphodiesterase
MRCFVGIPLPGELVEYICAAGRTVRTEDPSWSSGKWVPAQNLHITVHFLGDIDEAELGLLGNAMREALCEMPEFELPLGEVRAVPNTRRCRMVWATLLDPEGACAELARRVQDAAVQFGVPPEERRFTPHITLCRAKNPGPIKDHVLSAATSDMRRFGETVSVGLVTLYSSRLMPHGAVYSSVEEWQLRGA